MLFDNCYVLRELNTSKLYLKKIVQNTVNLNALDLLCNNSKLYSMVVLVFELLVKDLIQ